MDPLTQASLGAAAAAVLSSRERVRLAFIVGAAAGAAPDIDVLIKSAEDPLLALQYHRHFTHALIVAPFIGLIVALLFKTVFFWKEWSVGELARYGIAGALTHGVLDACTSYGTLLYWPFSSHRESWDIISIIDPIFTGPLVMLVLFAFAWKRPGFARWALALCLVYLVFGIIQRERATAYLKKLAGSRGHKATEMTVRPSFANTVLWRMIYRDGDQYFVDAVNLIPFSESTFYEGAVVEVFDHDVAANLVEAGSAMERDVERFRFFSQGYLYRAEMDAFVVGDLRYSMFPDSIVPLWGIELNLDEPEAPVSLRYFRDPSSLDGETLWSMIKGLPID